MSRPVSECGSGRLAAMPRRPNLDQTGWVVWNAVSHPLAAPDAGPTNAGKVGPRWVPCVNVGQVCGSVRCTQIGSHDGRIPASIPRYARNDFHGDYGVDPAAEPWQWP